MGQRDEDRGKGVEVGASTGGESRVGGGAEAGGRAAAGLRSVPAARGGAAPALALGWE